jgi:hypothetical protein
MHLAKMANGLLDEERIAARSPMENLRHDRRRAGAEVGRRQVADLVRGETAQRELVQASLATQLGKGLAAATVSLVSGR